MNKREPGYTTKTAKAKIYIRNHKHGILYRILMAFLVVIIIGWFYYIGRR